VALYRLEAKIIGRQSERKSKAGKPARVSVVAKAAYRSGEQLRDEQTGRVFNYRSRVQEVAHAEILAPQNAPAWANDRGQLWNEVARAEKRKDAQLAREFILALPVELSERQQVELVRGWCRDALVSKGLIADFSLHRSHDGRNPHAHILATMRPFEGAAFGQKARDMNAKAVLVAQRKAWEAHCNAALEEAGSVARVDCRSLAARGIDRIPQPKIGVAATAMQRRGLVIDPDNVRKARWVGLENFARSLQGSGARHPAPLRSRRWARLAAALGDDDGRAREGPARAGGFGRG
jgi:MobA/MobL family